MPLKTSQSRINTKDSVLREDAVRIAPRRFGWIDLEKFRFRMLLFITLALIAATVLGAFVHRTAQDNASLGNGEDKSLFSRLNPFANNQPGGGSELQLSKEYLYADSRLFAVEDSEATSVPPADLAIWRPATGQWWTMAGNSSRQMTISWGISSDVPAIGDYDGDGKTDFCVFRPGEGRWYLISSSSGDTSTSVTPFGSDGDVPAPADYDGDGKTDMAIWRPSTGLWFIRRSSDGGVTQMPLGVGDDIPAPKDYDGDGKADLAVWRPENATFYSVNSSDGELLFTYVGLSGAPVPADYDGDGRDDFAVRSGAIWKIIQSSNGITSETPWQNGQDVPVQNDYDGDGLVDIAAWSPQTGKWHIRQSSNGRTRIEQWGTTGDIPLPALYRR